MRTAVVGGGVLGLTLAYRLARLGHRVEVLEAAPRLGGLACAHDYGEFTWDRFYHCILPHDENLLALLRDLGLGSELRWRTTGTGYYGRGRLHRMSSNADFLRFPLLSIVDKARLGAAILYATRVADPYKLYRVSAADWLRRICGRRTYEVFWRPLLKAKLGTYHEEVAAVFIWATLKRLFGARSGTASREKLGYVSGGYARIPARFEEALRAEGSSVHVDAAVSAVRPVALGAGRPGCEVVVRRRGLPPEPTAFDQVFFTAPPRLARQVASADLVPAVERAERLHPTSAAYLGVACLALVLRRPLTPYYVLNIGEEAVEITGLIEMTNLVDPAVETRGRTLAYLPRYLDSEDPLLEAPDAALLPSFLDRGLKRLLPGFEASDVLYQGIHRARLVQPLPLVSAAPVAAAAGKVEAAPALERPFQMLGTYMLRCATLNNNEVVGLVDEFVARNEAELRCGARQGAGVAV
ncbi:MAG: FAD-dependent oxidoreductase [Planctomycetes bacterium]|nr:FAD-dependent oxidoreductase [Planctomycetota bacterium]